MVKGCRDYILLFSIIPVFVLHVGVVSDRFFLYFFVFLYICILHAVYFSVLLCSSADMANNRVHIFQIYNPGCRYRIHDDFLKIVAYSDADKDRHTHTHTDRETDRHTEQ